MPLERAAGLARRTGGAIIGGAWIPAGHRACRAGVRCQETGKAVMAQGRPDDFPLCCDEPLAGEDLTYVLYGSGGCSLYDTARLRLLGDLDSTYETAYVEDLDVGYRAWLRGWPSVYVAGAQVEHRHRATTSRYYTSQELDAILELNLLEVSRPRGLVGAGFPPPVGASSRAVWACRHLTIRLPPKWCARRGGIVLAGGLAAGASVFRRPNPRTDQHHRLGLSRSAGDRQAADGRRRPVFDAAASPAAPSCWRT